MLGKIKSFLTPKTPEPKKIYYARRFDVIVAYFEEDLPKLPHPHKVEPLQNMMIFTDRKRVPRTGNLRQLEFLARTVNRELSEDCHFELYVPYTIDPTVTLQESQCYQILTLTMPKAIMR